MNILKDNGKIFFLTQSTVLLLWTKWANYEQIVDKIFDHQYNGSVIVYIIMNRMCDMKTTVKKMDYEKVMALPRPDHMTPRKPTFFWKTLVRAICGLGMGAILQLFV